MTLIEILRCTRCQSKVALHDGRAPVEIGEPLLDKHLRCSQCSEAYPITADEIPIMWDDDVKAIITKDSFSGNAALSANFQIYETISNDYDDHSRNDPRLPIKLKNATSLVLENIASARLHLDFGCGPGQVIGWLKQFGWTQVGLDLSLNNLRNARRRTGCHVVCANACNMPFDAETFDVVTESSALHHIPDWRKAVSEAIRVCSRPGGVVIDSEPTKQQMAISKIAILTFEARFIAYKVLSYFRKDKYVFRSIAQAKLNATAEIHHQPGTGFPLDELREMFSRSGHDLRIVCSPSVDLAELPAPNWKEILLSVLSFRNPWAPEFGNFIAISTIR